MSRNNTQGVNQEFLNHLSDKNVLTHQQKQIAAISDKFKLSTVNLSTDKVKTIEDIEQELICTKYLPLRRNLMNNISADGGVGKTTISLILSIIFVLEEKYDYGRESYALFWASEDNSSDLVSNFNTICDDLLKLSQEDKEYAIAHITLVDTQQEIPEFLSGDRFNRKRTKEYADFLEMIEPFSLIILDPLLAFFSASDLNENDNSDAKKFMMLFTSITEKMKKTFVMLTHTSKHESGTRGASAFRDAFRYSVFISKYLVVQEDEEGKPVKTEKGEFIWKDDVNKLNIRQVRVLKDNGGVSSYLEANKPYFKFCYKDNYKIFNVELFTTEYLNRTKEVISKKDGCFMTDISSRYEQEYLDLSFDGGF